VGVAWKQICLQHKVTASRTFRAPQQAFWRLGALSNWRVRTSSGEEMWVFRNRLHNFRQLVDRSAQFGDRPFLVFDGGPRVSFAQHHHEVRATARWLAEDLGLEKGDRVAVCSANCVGWVLVAAAAMSLGIVVTALNSWWSADEIDAALALTEPKVLVADAKRRGRLQKRAGNIAYDRDRISGSVGGFRRA